MRMKMPKGGTYSMGDVMYPNQASKESRAAMDETVRRSGKKKKSPTKRTRDYTDDHNARGSSSPLMGQAKRSAELAGKVKNSRVMKGTR